MYKYVCTCRFLQTAEMLKPSTPTSVDETMVEYFPHILFLHNKSQASDFEPRIIKEMQVSVQLMSYMAGLYGTEAKITTLFLGYLLQSFLPFASAVSNRVRPSERRDKSCAES